MACKEAPACRAALDEATALFPRRSRASDGICGDPAHASRVSDHNPDSSGYAHAFDLTHDPANGCDVDALFAQLIARRDPRVKYVIRNRTIWRSYDKPGLPAWTPQPYTGSNPHTKHGHVSILLSATLDKSPWWAKELKAMFDPPLQVLGWCLFPSSKTGGTALAAVGPNGEVFCEPANAYQGGANGKTYFVGFRPLTIRPATQDERARGKEYVIEATSDGRNMSSYQYPETP